MKAIILAGGFGTRLQSVVKDVPKPMANINSKPFLQYILDKLNMSNVDEVVLSVGYKQEIIKNYFKDRYKNINILYSCEDKPLGTGGAIKQAINLLDTKENVLVLNGDTFFDLNIESFYEKSSSSDLSISLKPMKCFDRYGSVETSGNVVTSFKEKMFVDDGLINAGVYLIKKSFFNTIKENTFSFESFLQRQKKINFYVEDSYFVDIGIPQDYKKAQIDFKELF